MEDTLIRSLSLGAALVASVGLPAVPTQAGGPPAPQATFSIPSSNVSSAGPVLDDRHVVYGVAAPRFHRPVCVSCGQKPFTGFRVQVFIRDYQHHSSSTTLSGPRLLFAGPSGTQFAFYALANGWLVYQTYTSSGLWQLIARNVVARRTVLLDSTQMEGLHSRLSSATSDGRMVVWQSSRQLGKPGVPGFRSYTFATERREFHPGAETGAYYYAVVQVSGDRLLMLRDSRIRPTTQLFVENLVSHRIRALTWPGRWNSEPFISGKTVVWVHGSISIGHSRGLLVENLATGHRVMLARSSSQLPRVVAGRYIVFAPDYPTAYPKGSVEVYDTLSGVRRTIVSGPDASGFVPNGTVEAGGSAVLVRMDKPCSAAPGTCPAHFILVPLGSG